VEQLQDPKNGFMKLLVVTDVSIHLYLHCKGNLTDLRRILHLSLAKGNPKLIYKSK
jgi:hypothetical protein